MTLTFNLLSIFLPFDQLAFVRINILPAAFYFWHTRFLPKDQQRVVERLKPEISICTSSCFAKALIDKYFYAIVNFLLRLIALDFIFLS